MRLSGLFLICGLSFANAGELSYSLQSPINGGNNSALMQLESQRVNAIKAKESLIKSEAKQAAADAERLAQNTPAARFARALESQLYHSLAQQVINDINTLPNDQTGSFTTGDTRIDYKNIDGVLQITIITPSGTSTLEMPTR